MGFLDVLLGRNTNKQQEEEEKKRKQREQQQRQQVSTGNASADNFAKWVNGIGDAFRSGLTPSTPSTPTQPAKPTISNDVYNNALVSNFGPLAGLETTPNQPGKKTTAGNSPMLTLNEDNITGNKRGWGYGSGQGVDPRKAKEWDELLDPNSTRSKSMNPQQRVNMINNQIPAWYVNAYKTGTQSSAQVNIGNDHLLDDDNNILTRATSSRKNQVKQAQAIEDMRGTGRYDYRLDPWGNLADPYYYSDDYLQSEIDWYNDQINAQKLRSENAIHNIEDINDAFNWSYAAEQDFTNDKRHVSDIELEGYAKYIEGTDFDPRTATEDERKALTSRYMEWGLDDGVLKFKKQLRNNRTQNDVTLTENAGVTDSYQDWLNKLQKVQNYRLDYSGMEQEAARDPNYAQNAAYAGPLPGRDFASKLYNALNDEREMANFEMAYEIGGAASPITSEGYDLMTPKELQLFNWYAKQGRGQDFLDMIKPTLQHRNAAVQEVITKEFATENPGTAALSWGIGRFANLGTAFLYPFQAANAALGGETDAASSLYAPNRFVNDVSEAQTQVIANSNFLQIPGFEPGTNLGTWLYQAATSAADSLLGVSVGTMLGGGSATKLGKALANVVMSSEAASYALEDNLLRGLDPTHALLTSVADGMAEAISETWSIEALLSDPAHFLPYLAKNVFSEASEEGASAILQAIGDKIVNGDNTQYENDVNALILMGVKPEEANKQVMRAWLNDTLQSAIIGGLSGGLSAGGRALTVELGKSAAGKGINQQIYNNTVNRFIQERTNGRSLVNTQAADNAQEQQEEQRKAPESPDKQSRKETDLQDLQKENQPKTQHGNDETDNVNPENDNVNPENDNVNPENDNVNEKDDVGQEDQTQAAPTEQKSVRKEPAPGKPTAREQREAGRRQEEKSTKQKLKELDKEARTAAESAGEHAVEETTKQVVDLGTTLEEGSEARRLADAAKERLGKGKKLTGRQTFRLYNAIYSQLGEKNGQAIKLATRHSVQANLVNAGMDKETARMLSQAMTSVLLGEREKISKDDMNELLNHPETRELMAFYAGIPSDALTSKLLRKLADSDYTQASLRLNAYSNNAQSRKDLDNENLIRRIMMGVYTGALESQIGTKGAAPQFQETYTPNGTKEAVTYVDDNGEAIQGTIVKITTKAAAKVAEQSESQVKPENKEQGQNAAAGENETVKSDASGQNAAAGENETVKSDASGQNAAAGEDETVKASAQGQNAVAGENETAKTNAKGQKATASDNGTPKMSEEAREEWNRINAPGKPKVVKTIGGPSMTMEEFKAKNLRNQLSARLGKENVDSVNDIVVTVKDADGNTHDVSIDQITEASSDGVGALFDYAMQTPEILGTNKLNLMYQWYEGDEPEAYMSAFNGMYNAGFSGYTMSQDVINTLGETRAQAIYDAGRQAGQEAENQRKKSITSSLKRGSGTFGIRGVDMNDADAVKAFEDGLDANQKAAYDVLRKISENTPINIGVFRSKADANGVYTEENGHYDPVTNTVYIDMNAGRDTTAEGYAAKNLPLPSYAVLRTAGHELTHYIEHNSASGYAKLRSYVETEFMRHGYQDFEQLVADKQLAYARAGAPLTRDGAIAEVIADGMEMILQDSKAIERLGHQNRSLFETIRDWIHTFAENIRKAFSGVSAGSREAYALLRGAEHYRDQLVQMWDDAFIESLGLTEEEESVGPLAPSADVDQTISGDRTGFIEMPDNPVQDSIRTYMEMEPKAVGPAFLKKHDIPFEIHTTGVKKKKMVYASGRDITRAILEENGFKGKQIEETMAFMDSIADYMKDAEVKYHFVGLQDVNSATATIDPDSGRILLSCKIKNDEYEVNFDLGTVCKKRQALQNLFNELAARNGKNGATKLDDIELTSEHIFRINEILKDNGYETACLGCFVEARRYKTKAWAERVVGEWNAEVLKQNPKAAYFDFARGKTDIDKMSAADKKAHYDALNAYNSKGTSGPRDRMKRLAAIPTMQKLLRTSDLISEQGRDRLRKFSSTLDSIAQSRDGANAIKPTIGFIPYNSEMALLPATKTKKGKRMTMAQYLKSIGGARSQSFTDFIVTQAFDHLQKTVDMAARKVTAHTYTKELGRAWLFGMTGEKINMSVLFDIDPKQGWQNAGLDENGEYIVGDYVNAQKQFEKTGKRPFTQSIPFQQAVALEHNPLYSKNVGIIGVGYSYNHMKKMLSDENIPYIIMYHRSGMPQEVATAANIAMTTDYTPVQNTQRFLGFRTVMGDGHDVPSYASWGQLSQKKTGASKMTYNNGENGLSLKQLLNDHNGDPIAAMNDLLSWMDKNKLTMNTSTKAAGHGDFDLYGSLNKTMDPAATANEYISWCLQNEMLPLGWEFCTDPGYYKILYDYSVTDLATGETAVQMPVTLDSMLEIGAEQWIKGTDGVHGLDHFMAAYDSTLQRDQSVFEQTLNQVYDELAEQPATQGGPAQVANPAVKTAAVQHSIRMSDSEKADLDSYYNESIQKNDMRSAEIAVKQMALQWGAYQKPDGDMYFYHGTNAEFNRFDPDKIGSSGAGSYMGYGFNFAADESMASGYGTNLKKVFLRIENPLLPTQRTITAAKLARIIQQIENFKPADFDGDEWTNSLVWNYDSNMPSFRAGAYEKRNAYMQATRNVARTIIESAESDTDIYSELSGSGGADSAAVISAFQKLGYDAVLHNNSDGTKLRAAIVFSPSQIKSAEIITRDDDGNVIPLSKRFSQSEDIRYSLRTTELHQQALDASRELVQAINDGDTERAQEIEASDATIQYSIREEDPPKKTIIAYKAFYARDGKLYPPMISNQSEKEQKVSKATSGTMKGLPTPVGVWLNADVGGIAVDPETGEPFRAATTGRLRAWNAKSGGGPGKVPSASNTLAFRPGWHLGEWPDAKQFNKNDPVTGKQKSVMPDDLVFAKCEISADVDYQLESIAYGVGSNGKFNRSQAGLPRIPTDGYYKYRTNPDPNTAPWYISGAMRVVEILDDDDCAAICAQYGVKPDERYSHKKINLADFGLKRGPVEPTTDIDAYKKNAANYANEEVLERALNDEQYANAYRERAIDFDDPIVANEFAINKQDIEAYRKLYNEQQENKAQRSLRITQLTDTREFLMALTPEDLATDAERSILASYKAKVEEFGSAQAMVEKYENDLLNEPKGATHDQTQKHYNQVEVARKRRDRIQAELDRIENSPGYAAVLAKTRKAMSVIQTATSGGNIDQYLEAMRNRLVTAEGRIDDILRDLQDWPKPSEGTTARLVFGKSQLNQQVSNLMKRNPSTLSRDEVTDTLAHIALLFNVGDADSIQSATVEIQDLARKMQLQKNESIESYELTQLADAIGAFSLNDNQKKEVKRVYGSINNFRKALQGYGKYDPKAGSLDANWAEIVGMTGNQLELNVGDAQEPIALVDLISSTIQSAQAAQALSPEDQQAEFEEIQGEILMAATSMKSAIPLSKEAVTAIQDFTKQFGNRVEKLDAQLMQIVNDADHARANADLVQATYTANTGNIIKGVDAIRTYYSKVADQYTREIMLQKERELKSKYDEQLKLVRSKAALKMEQSVAAYQNMLQKHRELRDLAQKIRTTRNIVRRQVMRINKALTAETNSKHVPEELKGLAEATVKAFAKADRNGRGIVLSPAEAGEILLEYTYLIQRDGDLDSYQYDPDTLAMLAELQKQLQDYRQATMMGDYSNLENQRLRLQICQNIAQVMENIGGMISSANSLFIGGQMHSVAQASEMMGTPMFRLPDFRVATGTAGRAATNLDDFARWGNLTPYYFKRQVNNTGLTALMDDLETSEHRWGLGMQAAHDRLAEIQNNYHYYDWDDATVSIDDGRGGKIELTREQAMAILAIWQREHYDQNFRTYHLEEGGFVLADDGKKRGKGILGLDDNPRHRTMGTRITAVEIDVINNFLTDEQKAYMKEVVNYLSNDMSQIGNATSMQLYGIKKYKEKYYFPIQSYRGGMRMKSDAGSVNPVNDSRIEHVGFSNSRLRGANNTILISDFSQTAAGHIQQMLMYSNFAPTIEALNKTLNAMYMMEDGHEVRIRQLFEMKYGKNAVGYLQDYIKALNGGVNPDTQDGLVGKMISLFKKTAVVGSLSVAAKQPMSIIRAATMINPRYLAAAVGSNLIRMHGQASFEEAEKYAGTAVIKDIGKFDTGVGMSNVDWLLERDSTEYDLWTKAKEALNPRDWETWKARWNDILGFLPSRGDSVTWGAMWEAVKMEQHALHPSMNQYTEEFLQMCGQRFNEIMRATQVYDSTIAKAPNVRSQSQMMKMLSAFMNEPVLTANMLYDAIKNAKNKGMKNHINPAAAGACFILSAAAQAFITSLFSALRSDDKDKTILEKMAGTFGNNLRGEINPFNLIPGVADLVEVLEGGDIERTDLSAVTDAVNKLQKLASGKYAVKDLRSAYVLVEDVGGSIAKLFGVPVKNIMREVRTIWNVFTQPARGTDPTVFGMSLAEGLHVLPDKFFGFTLVDTSTQAYVQRLYNALRSGNDQQAADIHEYLVDGKGVKEGSISSKLKSLLYEDFIQEKITMDNAIDFGIQNGLWNKEKDAYSAIIKAADKTSHADEEEYSTSAYVNIFNALLAGDKAAYTAAVNDMAKHGYTEKGIASAAKSQIAEWYKEGELDQAKAKAMLAMIGITGKNDVYWTLDSWDYQAEHGDTTGYSKYDAFIQAVASGTGLQAAIQEQVTHSDKSQKEVYSTLAGQITSAYKQQYIDLVKAGRTGEAANLQARLLTAYEALGYNRHMKQKDIQKWLK